MVNVMKRTDGCNAVGHLVARDTMHHLTYGNVQGGAHLSIQADMAKRDKCTVGLFEQFTTWAGQPRCTPQRIPETLSVC